MDLIGWFIFSTVLVVFVLEAIRSHRKADDLEDALDWIGVGIYRERELRCYLGILVCILLMGVIYFW